MAALPYSDGGPINCPATLNLDSLKGKSVLVTGGSSGLGAAYVDAFRNAGAFVTNADIRAPEASKASTFVQTDVTSWEAQVNAFKSALKLAPGGRLDVVVANAGVSGSDLFYEGLDEDEPQEPNLRILHANLLAVVYTCKLAVHYMRKQPDSDKCLILKSSIMGYLDTNGSPTYGAAKHGVRGLMGHLRRRSGLRVNLVAPWYISTPLLSPTVMEKITPQLKAQGSDFALVEDSVRAVLRLATDNTVNGRGLTVLPRADTPSGSGYMDLNLDDFEEGTLYHRLQEICNHLTHRQLPQSQQQV